MSAKARSSLLLWLVALTAAIMLLAGPISCANAAHRKRHTRHRAKVHARRRRRRPRRPSPPQPSDRWS